MKKALGIIAALALAGAAFGQGISDVRIEDRGGETVTATDNSLDANVNNDNLARARGIVTSQTTINKFGHTDNADNGIPTDVWDGANATTDQDLWIAATTSQTFRVNGTNANDHVNGLGARTIKIYGLTDWDTAETNETVSLAGITNVFTANKYVIVHRAKITTAGTNGVNYGNITIDAHGDDTLQAMILAGAGQTKMAIYGIPSTQNLYIYNMWAAVNRSVASTRGEMILHVNEDPENYPLMYLHKHTFGLNTAGTSAYDQLYMVPKKISGPAIIRMEFTSSVDNTAVDGGFDAVLVTE